MPSISAPRAVRPPRVRISYDVRVGNTTVKKELPFVLGVVGDFCGQFSTDSAAQPVRGLAARGFVEISRDKIDAVLKGMAPGLNLRVKNMLEDDGTEIGVRLTFQSMKDFQPAGIVAQVPPLKDLMEARWRLMEQDEPSCRMGFSPSTANLDGLKPIPQDHSVSREVAELDRRLGAQVNEILHHPRFQTLEAAWRGLCLLAEGTGGQENLKIKLLHLPKAQLDADLHGAVEFDQSEFFRKVYEQEYGLAGGEPYGALIGNYEFRNSPGDLDLLSKIKEVAAAAFVPFIAGVDPMMFGVPHFGLLPRISNLQEVFNSPKYVKWNSLREHVDSRYLGLVLPRILMRLPYGRDPQRVDGFVFQEDVSAADSASYLWGNAAFAFGNVLLRAFALSGWFADIRGIAAGPEAGGVVDLPAQSYATDRPGVAVKYSVDAIIGEARDKELSDLGFITLCDCQDTEYSAFFANQSIQKPEVYQANNQDATSNARISSMLQYVLCASRFAHYVKVIGRDKVGQIPEPRQLESFLHNWVYQYVATDPGADMKTRASRPLREAKIEVDESPGDPGHFRLKLFLAPHVQLDQLSAGIRLVTALPKS